MGGSPPAWSANSASRARKAPAWAGSSFGLQSTPRLGAEIGDRDIRLIKLALRQRHALVGSTQVACGVQRDERGVYGVARPAIGSDLEGITDLLTTLSRTNLR